MEPVSDASTNNLMQEIKKQTKKVKSLSNDVTNFAKIYHSDWTTNEPHIWAMDELQANITGHLLKITDPYETRTAKEWSHAQCRILEKNLNIEKRRHMDRETRLNTHLNQLHSAQYVLNDASCILNEQIADLLGYMTQLGFMTTSNKETMISVTKQIEKFKNEERSHNHSIHILEQTMQTMKETQRAIIEKQNFPPNPKRGFFSRASAEQQSFNI